MIRVLIRQKSDRPLLLYYVDPETGREVSRSAGTHDRGEAERAAALWEQELRGYRGDRNDGWEYFRDRFRDEHLATLGKRSVSSFGTALNHYRRVMNPATVSDVTATAISQYQAKLLAEKRPLTSVRNYLTHLRASLRWAAHVGMIPKAPSIKLPRQPSHTFMRGREVSVKDFRSILRKCKSKRLRRLMRLIWLSGLRLNEALLLSWDAPPILIDLDAEPYPRILYYAEGHKARRDDVVPMTPELAAWLKRTPRGARRGLVAPIGTKQRRRATDKISAVCREAEVFVTADQPATAHDLRRAFATRMARRVMPMTLQRLMRHADLTTTLRYYVGLSSIDAGRELWGRNKDS